MGDGPIEDVAAGRFDGKVVLVTGGSRGLGEATVRAFADRGAAVGFSFVTARARADRLAAEFGRTGADVRAFRADQADRVAATRLVAEVVAGFGKLDVLVANASVDVFGSIDDPKRDDVARERFWAVALSGMMATVAAASRSMVDGGRIVLIGSSLGQRASLPGLSDLAAAKGAIDGFCGGVARDLASRDITVNVVHAGPMRTDTSGGAGYEALAPIFEQMCFPRFGRLEEVVAPILFLASSSASFITGSSIEANGGANA